MRAPPARAGRCARVWPPSHLLLPPPAAAAALSAAQVSPWSLAALAPGSSTRISTYPLMQVTAIKTLRDDPSALLIYAGGRPHLYATPERSEVMRLLAGHLTRLGLTSLIADAAPSAADYRAERAALAADSAPRVAEFSVLKRTPKSAAAKPRRLVLTEASLQERDSSTYAVVSARPLASLHSVTRHWDEPQVRFSLRRAQCRSAAAALCAPSHSPPPSAAPPPLASA